MPEMEILLGIKLLALLVSVLIVVMLLFFGVLWKLLDDIKKWQHSQWKELRGTYVNAAATAEVVDKMHRNMCAIIAEKMVDEKYPIKKGEPLDKPFEEPQPSRVITDVDGGHCILGHE